MSASAVVLSPDEARATEFIQRITRLRLFDYDSTNRTFVQRFSQGTSVDPDDIDHARVFAEQLRSTYGDCILVEQSNSVVRFSLRG